MLAAPRISAIQSAHGFHPSDSGGIPYGNNFLYDNASSSSSSGSCWHPPTSPSDSFTIPTPTSFTHSPYTYAHHIEKNMFVAEACALCDMFGHSIEECPLIPFARDAFNAMRGHTKSCVSPYSEACNFGRKIEQIQQSSPPQQLFQSQAPHSSTIQNDHYSTHATYESESTATMGYYQHGSWAHVAPVQHAHVAPAPPPPVEYVHQPFEGYFSWHYEEYSAYPSVEEYLMFGKVFFC